MRTDHWNKRALDFLKPHFDQAQRLVQIATGFFTIQGYDMVRGVLAGKMVQLLVGFDEQSKERLRQKLIEDIMAHLGQWSAEDRRAAVQELVERIQAGRFILTERRERDERIDARTRSRDHAKVFILDESKVIVGSINLTAGGLLYNAESCTLQDDPERVRFFVDTFQEYWNDKNTYDLTEALLQALLEWLKLRPPFEVYLKAIQELIRDEEVEAPRESYKMPVEYQQVVIARVLRQLRQYRGAMLVASTGLGKTVMATHVALRLAQERKTINYLVFAPKQVHPDWKRALKSAGLSCDVFTRELLDRAEGAKGRKTLELHEALDHLDDKYLIILDESQYFRNQLRAVDGRKRHSFNRLMDNTSKKKPYVLLLTATPYSKQIADLNSQLLLLPHTAEKKYVTSKGQFVLPGMVDELIAPEAWKVQENDQYFEQFLNLPVSTVMSTSQVAKDFATQTAEGEYLMFGAEKRWIPQIGITKVTVPLLLESEMVDALQQRSFEHHRLRFKHRDTWRISTTTIQKEAEIAWTSSPAALRSVVHQTIDDSYQVKFKLSAERRRETLQPVLERLTGMSAQDDAKLMQLVNFLQQFKQDGRKVILFTERLSTAIYLEEALQTEAPEIAVANTVMQTSDGPTLKDFEPDVLQMIKGFAPVANADKIGPREKLVPYDLFISTDAYSTGVNLQDASVVINYDLAWTPDVIIQRAGRILRFWPNPRRVDFFVFLGDFTRDQTKAKQTLIVENRLRKLVGRSSQAEKFSELPLLPESDQVDFASLGSLSAIKIEYLGLADPGQIEEFSGVSPFLRHVAVLQEHKLLAESIPNDISSAMTYPGDSQLIFLLLDFQGQAEIVLYDISNNQLLAKKEDEILDMIACTEKTPLAEVDPGQLERWAQRAKNLWMAKRQILPEVEIPRICALYLIPEGREPGLEHVMLRKSNT